MYAINSMITPNRKLYKRECTTPKYRDNGNHRRASMVMDMFVHMQQRAGNTQKNATPLTHKNNMYICFAFGKGCSKRTYGKYAVKREIR